MPWPALPAGVIQLLPSLLAFDPASLGVPPFADTVCGLTPLEQPLLIKGTVVKGFGRGSRVRGHAGLRCGEGQGADGGG